jgi:hypothetical protein
MSDKLRIQIIDDEPNGWNKTCKALKTNADLEVPQVLTINEAWGRLESNADVSADIYVIDIANDEGNRSLTGDRVGNRLHGLYPGSLFVLVSSHIDTRGKWSGDRNGDVGVVVKDAVENMPWYTEKMSKKGPMQTEQSGEVSSAPEPFNDYMPRQLKALSQRVSIMRSFAPDVVHILPRPNVTSFPVDNETLKRYCDRVGETDTTVFEALLKIKEVMGFLSEVRAWPDGKRDPNKTTKQSSIMFVRRGKAKAIPELTTAGLAMILSKMYVKLNLSSTSAPFPGWDSVSIALESKDLTISKTDVFQEHDLTSFESNTVKDFRYLHHMLAGRQHEDIPCFAWENAKTSGEDYLEFKSRFPCVTIHFPPCDKMVNKKALFKDWPPLKTWQERSQT